MTHVDLANMPVADKIQLMESLWESLGNDANVAAVIPAWHDEVLAERSKKLGQGQEQVSAWDDAKQRIREQIAKQ